MGRPKGSKNKTHSDDNKPAVLHGIAKAAQDMSLAERGDGDNGRYALHTLQVWSLPPIDTRNAEAVNMRTGEYMQMCINDDIKPSLEGYALALGLSRPALIARLNGRTKGSDDAVAVMRRFHNLLTANTVTYLQEGKMNPLAAFFLLRNNAGYTNDENRAPSFTPEDDGGADDIETIAARYTPEDIPD